MRFSTNVAYGLFAVALLGFGGAHAEELDDTLEEAVKTASTSTSAAAIHKPAFTPLSLKAPFFEQFTDDWQSRWKVSHAKKQNDKSGDEEWAYVGEWSVEEPLVLKGIQGDKGLVVKNVAAHHAISAKFPTPVDPTDKPLVVQYEVKMQDGLDCGGAYVKLLRENKDLHLEEFSNASPYVIMFGPDKCGATNKVHFIFNHKNPKTGEYEEKHLKSPPMAKITKLSTLYTLIVNPDQTYELKIDGKSAKKGSLFVDFSPAVNPEKEIDDPEDKKPADWVDTARIEDPDAKKPDDWDEDAPYEIVDEDAQKPDDWLENEPEFIPDPEAEKPEDWDDDEDGDWVPPTVPNPKCEQASGCGKWEKPMKANPDYKGKWTPPMIDNPAYKGPWAPRKIPNPNYFEDKAPSNFEPIGAIGFELWTMTKDILFDNIYIGHSITDAEKLEKEAWAVKRKIEEEEDKASQPKTPEPSAAPGSFKDDPVNYIRNKLQVFLAIAQKDPVSAFKEFPEVGFSIITAVITIFAVLGGLISAFSAPTTVKTPAKKLAPASDAQPETKIQEAADAEASGNEKPKASRRTSKKA